MIHRIVAEYILQLSKTFQLSDRTVSTYRCPSRVVLSSRSRIVRNNSISSPSRPFKMFTQVDVGRGSVLNPRAMISAPNGCHRSLFAVALVRSHVAPVIFIFLFRSRNGNEAAFVACLPAPPPAFRPYLMRGPRKYLGWVE